MKKLWIVLAALALTALVVTCSLANSTVSESSCINSFVSDVDSNNFGSLYNTLDQNSSYYSEAKSAAYWTGGTGSPGGGTIFPSTENYTITSVNIVSTNTVTATLNSSSSILYNGVTITFSMTTDASGNYVIQTIVISGGRGTVFQ
jgi:hypothetical protein